MLSTTVPLLSSFQRQSGSSARSNGTSAARIPILIVLFFTLVLLLGNVTQVTETVHNVSSSSTVATIQKALVDSHKLVASYAGYNTGNTSKPKQKRYIVLPATAANPGFCRTLFALLINDYGPPTIVSLLGHYAEGR